MSLLKFLTRHADDLVDIVEAIESIARMLPLGREDKKNITKKLDKVKKASESVKRQAKNAKEIKVDEKSIEKAVEAALPKIIDKVGDKVFALSNEKKENS